MNLFLDLESALLMEWKSPYMTSIYKSGSRDDIINYRLISVFSVILKLFESPMVDKLKTKIFLFISQRQHGFVPKRYTETDLLFTTYLKFIRKQDAGWQFYTDFNRVFNLINQGLLIVKITSFWYKWLITQVVWE